MKIFISHASADSDFAMKVARRLSDEGLKVFRRTLTSSRVKIGICRSDKSWKPLTPSRC